MVQVAVLVLVVVVALEVVDLGLLKRLLECRSDGCLDGVSSWWRNMVEVVVLCWWF